MTDFLYLIPVALALGAVGLGAFLWSLRSGQYEDLDGAAERILLDEDDSRCRKQTPLDKDPHRCRLIGPAARAAVLPHKQRMRTADRSAAH